MKKPLELRGTISLLSIITQQRQQQAERAEIVSLVADANVPTCSFTQSVAVVFSGFVKRGIKLGLSKMANVEFSLQPRSAKCVITHT